MLRKLLGGLIVVALLGPTPWAAADAAILYSNPWNAIAAGDCSWDTACAATAGRGNDYAAQEFTLSTTAMITSAAAIVQDVGTTGATFINWSLYAAQFGSPAGGALFTGSSSIAISPVPSSVMSVYTFDIGARLDAGTYFLAMQDVSSTIQNYLQQGTSASGAAETFDGGTTWSPNYEGNTSIALTLTGTAIPEPMMLTVLGSAVLGLATMRRRRA